MKQLLTLILSLCTVYSFSQNSADSKVVIVACKAGDLYIDGTMTASISADDARQERLSYGDHYFQLKTPTEKFNVTVKVDANTKDIIKLGCTAPISIQTSSTRILEKQLTLLGSLTNISDQNIVGLDDNDQIILSCSVLNKKGTANVSIRNYNTQTEIYKNNGFNSIQNETIKIPNKGVYIINFSTAALFGKEVKFSIDRIPSPNSSPNFKTTVKKVFDTSNVEILNTSTRVYSTTNIGHSNKTTLKLNLPPNTAYWTYWIGVGQEAREKMKDFVTQLSKAGSFFSVNPVVLFGMKLIPTLPMLNATSTVSYQFMDTPNSQLFLSNQRYSYFMFKYANNIATDYALIDVKSPDIVLALWNTNTAMGQDVDVKVVAFVIKSRLSLEE